MGAIGDGHTGFLVLWNGCDESNDECLRRRLPALDFLGGRDRKNGEVHRIEAQFLDRLAIGFELKSLFALEGALLEVRRQVERQMADFHLAVGRVFAVSASPSGRKETGRFDAFDVRASRGVVSRRDACLDNNKAEKMAKRILHV